jgi:hypothetical protein
MRTRVHIERLILDGLPLTTEAGARVRAAVETELARLLAAQGVPEHLRLGGAVPAIAAPRLRFAADDRPDTIGRNIARSIHRGIANDR